MNGGVRSAFLRSCGSVASYPCDYNGQMQILHESFVLPQSYHVTLMYVCVAMPNLSDNKRRYAFKHGFQA
jgi:hypothetical protein